MGNPSPTFSPEAGSPLESRPAHTASPYASIVFRCATYHQQYRDVTLFNASCYCQIFMVLFLTDRRGSMTTNITKAVKKRIRTKKPGWVFTPREFVGLGTRAAID